MTHTHTGKEKKRYKRTREQRDTSYDVIVTEANIHAHVTRRRPHACSHAMLHTQHYTATNLSVNVIVL